MSKFKRIAFVGASYTAEAALGNMILVASALEFQRTKDWKLAVGIGLGQHIAWRAIERMSQYMLINRIGNVIRNNGGDIVIDVTSKFTGEKASYRVIQQK